jgi:ubiquinone/menaquinone biosynthesis C-methylase UbiE
MIHTAKALQASLHTRVLMRDQPNGLHLGLLRLCSRAVRLGVCDTARRGVAEVFGRAAHTYGRVGPDFFDFFGHRVVGMIGETLGGSVLDVGCGAGATLVAASAAVDEDALVIGVDLSREMLLRAGGAVAETDVPVFVALADAQRLPFPDGIFDTVVSSFALGYFRVL